MSDSYKKAIIKDRIRNGNPASEYWKPIRRTNKQIVKKFRENTEEDEYPRVKNPKEIVDDYDRCDYIIDFEYTIKENKDDTIKNRRK